MKTWTKRVLCAAAAAGTVGLLLGAAQGSETDPLVTMSYITQIATPQIMKDLDAKLDAREQSYLDKLDTAIAQFEKDMDAKLSEVSGGGGELTTSVFAVVQVKAGQTLAGLTGTEFLLRTGSAACVAASAPGLIDSTDGTSLSSGEAVQPNHLYLSTADGRGMKAGADATVMVRGSYSIT